MRARDYRGIARASLVGNWGLTIGVTLVASLMGGYVMGGSVPTPSFKTIFSQDSWGYHYFTEAIPLSLLLVLGSIFSILAIYSMVVFILGGVVSQGLCLYNIDLVTKYRPVEFSTLFARFSNFLNAFLLRFLMSLFTFLWTLLFIIPGIMKYYSYSMAPFLMAQNPSMTPLEAISASKEMMRGNRWKLFCLEISFIGWSTLAMFTFGIGFLWLIPYQNAATAAFYLNLTKQLPGQFAYAGAAPVQAPPAGYPAPPQQ